MIDVPVLVKDALRDGRRLKNYKINVMQDDGITLDFVIDNNSLVSESVIFDERMSSGKDLVFGLCEGASIEFQYFDHPSILGRRIQVLIDVQYQTANNELSWYEIPIGWFDVDACPRQASTGIRKVTAFNKLKSDYLDQKANDNLQNLYLGDYTLSIFDIKKALLGSYKIDEAKVAADSSLSPYSVIENYYPGFGSFKFTQLYGIDTPINPYEMSITDTTTSFSIGAISIKIPFRLPYVIDPNQPYYVDAARGSLLGLEQNVVEYFKNLINNAHLDKDWDDALDYVCTHAGFQKVIGVEVQGSSTIKYYSTVQWEYEEAHNLTHTVAGPLSEIAYQKCPETVNLVYPEEVQLNSLSRVLYLYGRMMNNYEWEDTYHYYADPQQTELLESDFPACLYSDHTPFVRDEVAMWIYKYTELPPADLITFKISEMPDFTLRDLTSAVYETVCQYGRLDRVTDLFAGIELNRSQLLPQDTLYPATDLYPGGPSFSAARSTYSKLWADEDNVQKFRYLIITYKGLDGDNKEKEFTLQRTVNPDGTQDYYCSDNWLFKNLVWTANDIGAYADAMAAKMQDIRWFPFEMWCAGLPYLETGDAIEIPMGEDSYTSYILQRNLNGIQNLQDTFINGTLDIF